MTFPDWQLLHYCKGNVFQLVSGSFWWWQVYFEYKKLTRKIIILAIVKTIFNCMGWFKCIIILIFTKTIFFEKHHEMAAFLMKNNLDVEHEVAIKLRAGKLKLGLDNCRVN